MLNSLGKFIELGHSILRFWLGSGRLVPKLIVCSILNSQNLSRCQSQDSHICSLRRHTGPQRQEACYATDGEKIEPLKRQNVCDDKRPHQKPRPQVGKLRACTPPSKIFFKSKRRPPGNSKSYSCLCHVKT